MFSIRFISALIIIASFASCEKRINPDELNLKNAASKYVIEGYVSSEKGPYYIRVSKSTGYFTPGTAATVDNAIVVLSDDAGNKETLSGNGSGVYQTAQFETAPGRTYYLTVSAGNQTFTASSSMPQKISIDTLTYIFRKEVDHGNEEGYFVTTEATDPFEVSNYYRLKAFRNGRVFNDKDDYVVMTDFTFNGARMRKEFPAEYVPGDTATIELWSIDYASYLFYRSLEQQINVGDSPQMTQPGNVRSNIQGGAIGLFCAYAVDRKTVIIR